MSNYEWRVIESRAGSPVGDSSVELVGGKGLEVFNSILWKIADKQFPVLIDDVLNNQSRSIDNVGWHYAEDDYDIQQGDVTEPGMVEICDYSSVTAIPKIVFLKIVLDIAKAMFEIQKKKKKCPLIG